MGTAASGGKGFKGRAVSGDRPIGTAGCRQQHIRASCQIPLLPATVPCHEAATVSSGTAPKLLSGWTQLSMQSRHC